MGVGAGFCMYITMSSLKSLCSLSHLLMSSCTDFCQQNFTKFKHNTSIGIAMNPFGTKFWKFSREGVVPSKTQKSIFSTSCNFRPP